MIFFNLLGFASFNWYGSFRIKYDTDFQYRKNKLLQKKVVENVDFFVKLNKSFFIRIC